MDVKFREETTDYILDGLEGGQLFLYEGEVYMKIKTIEINDKNVVSVKEGRTYHFDFDIAVIPLTGKFIEGAE